MIQDKETLGILRRKEIMNLVLAAADKGDILSLSELHGSTQAATTNTKHSTLWYVRQLEEAGFLERRWGDDMVKEISHGKKSYIIATGKAYRFHLAGKFKINK